jgi:hypothetical protein
MSELVSDIMLITMASMTTIAGIMVICKVIGL